MGDERGKISNWLKEEYSLILMDAGFSINSPLWHRERERYGLTMCSQMMVQLWQKKGEIEGNWKYNHNVL